MSSDQVLYFHEISRFFKKNSRRIFNVIVFFFVFIYVFLLLTLQPQYFATASFRQAKSREEDTSSFQAILKNMGMAREEFSAFSVMESNRLLGKVIEETGLQVQPVKNARSLKCRELFFRECRLPFTKKQYQFRDVFFAGKSKKTFFLQMINENAFTILNAKKKKIAEGILGVPVHFEGGQLTVTFCPPQKKLIAFDILPKRSAIEKLKKKLKIKSNRFDPSIIVLNFFHHQRKTAIAVLDSVMIHFQKYLQAEHEELAAAQINYLQKRKGELARGFEEALEEHVAYLKKNVGTEGFLGFSQELDLLAAPQKLYSSKNHYLDLEAKRWKKDQFFAKAEHPWKEGISRERELDLAFERQNAKFLELSGTISEEFAGIDLETAESIYNEYIRKREKLLAEVAQLDQLQTKLQKPDFEISALSVFLTDPVSQKSIQKGAELSLQLVDSKNRSEKELVQAKEMLDKQKTFLSEHVIEKKQLMQADLDLIEGKLASLQFTALQLIEKEKEIVQNKLGEFTEKMGKLPEKWRQESQLVMKKELTMQMIEELTKLSESKVIDHHLFHIESKPIDMADAPLQIQPPHLFLFSSMGGLLAGFFFFSASLVCSAYRGLPLSEASIRNNKYTCIKNTPQEVMQRISLEIQPKEVIAILGEKHIETLAQFLSSLGNQVLCIELGVEKPLSTLEDHDVISIETIQHINIPKKIASWKNRYDYILVHSIAPLTSAEALSAARIADRCILHLTEATEETLRLYDPEKTLCVLSEFS